MCDPRGNLQKQRQMQENQINVVQQDYQLQVGPVQMQQNLQQQNVPQGEAVPEQELPAQTLEDASIRLLGDERFFGDSWRMKQVKDRLREYSAFQRKALTAKTDFETLKADAVDLFRELIRSCEEYLEARTKGGKESKRHGKVRAVMEAARATLAQTAGLRKEDYDRAFENKIGFGTLLRKDSQRRDPAADPGVKEREKQGMDTSRRREHSNLYGEQLSALKGNEGNTLLLKTLESIREKQGGLLPADANEFEKTKGQMDQLFDQAIRRAEEIRAEGAYLNKNKVRRDVVGRLLSQLKWEKERLAEADFAALSTSFGNRTWDSIWSEEVVSFKASEVSQEFMDSFRYDDTLMLLPKFYRKEKDGEGKNAPTKRVLAEEYAGIEGRSTMLAEKGTRRMAELLGVGNLFAGYKEAKLINQRGKSFSGYLVQQEGLKLSEALDNAAANDLELIYSDEALEQLVTIQLLDVICGQLQRTEDSLRVQIAPQSVEGKNYMVIKSVMAVDNSFSFGTAKFDDINKNGVQSTLKRIWDEQSGEMLLDRYDPAVADRIISLDPVQAIEVFRNTGMDREQLDAMYDRLTRLQQILSADKASPDSFRSRQQQRLEDAKKKEKYDQMSAEDKAKFDEKRKRKRQSRYSTQYQIRDKVIPTYVNPALVRDIGEKKDVAGFTYNDGYWSVTESNKFEDEKLNSVKARKKALAACAELVMEDKIHAGSAPLSPEFDRIMNLMLNYSVLDATAEKGIFNSRNSLLSMRDILNGMNGLEISDELRTHLEGMKTTFGLPMLEAELLKELLSEIKARLADLETQDQTDEAVKYEVTRLKAYQKQFDGRNGNLPKPKKVEKDERAFKKGQAWKFLDGDGKELKPENFKDESNTPLFVHEPSIEDIAQTGLGDCYFQATLASLVEKDPKFIKDHMRDNGDGTVTVRFYDLDKNLDYQPIHIRVKKEIPADANGNYLMAGSALWVNLYEKAYVLSGLHEKYIGKNADGARKNLKHLTDQAEIDEMQKHVTLHDNFVKNGQQGIRSYKDIVGGSPEFLLDLLTGERVKSIQFDVDLAFDDHKEKKKIKKDRRVRLKDGTLKFDGDMNAIVEFTTEQIETATKNGDVIVAGSRRNFIDHSGNYGGSGENIERGFASPHAYTIVGIERRGDIPYVRLRNPWGSDGGVEAVRNQISGKITYREADETRGTFPVDMKTFVTYLAEIHVVNTKKGRP